MGLRYPVMVQSNSAFPIQLAIQGGGAKIYALMAAMEAVQDLQEKGIIKVTKIAGTSAGAIVGCLFAAGIRMETLRARLRGMSTKEIKRLFPDVGVPGAMLKFTRGQPLWETSRLEAFLTSLLDS